MNFAEIFAQNKLVFIVMGVFIIGSIFANIILAKKRGATRDTYLEQNPDAVKVYLATKAISATGGVQITSVDGKTPAFFNEGMKPGFYLKPGISEVTMSYTRQTGRRSYTTYGPATKKLEIEAGKSYVILFDKDEETFTFEEYEAQ